MYDQGKENRHTTLLAGLILMILLAAVAAFAAPVAEPGGQQCWIATAVPERTVFLVDVTNPTEKIDQIADMGSLPELAGLMRVIGEQGKYPFLTKLGAILESWNSDPTIRSDVQFIADRRAVFVLLRSEQTRLLLPLLALRGEAGADPLGALDSLSARLGLGAVVTRGSTTATQSFTIEDVTGPQFTDGRVAGDWTVMGPPGTGERAEELALCLAGLGSCPEDPLASLPEFESTLARLPDEAPIHGYLNTPQLREFLARTVGSEPASLLDWTDGVAFARSITIDGFETWATGRFVTTKRNDPLTRLLENLVPIGRPLSAHLPDGALAAYDLGASPIDIIGVFSQYLETILPGVHARLRGMVDEFRTATGLDPERDLLLSLDRGIAVGVLPSEDDPQAWPLPRPILLIRSTDDASVRRFTEEWLKWEAGALAPMTQGVLGATVVTQWAAGAQLTGLQLDSVFDTPTPLPSPAIAVVNGLVIASPVRSAVTQPFRSR